MSFVPIVIKISGWRCDTHELRAKIFEQVRLLEP